MVIWGERRQGNGAGPIFTKNPASQAIQALTPRIVQNLPFFAENRGFEAANMDDSSKTDVKYCFNFYVIWVKKPDQ